MRIVPELKTKSFGFFRSRDSSESDCPAKRRPANRGAGAGGGGGVQGQFCHFGPRTTPVFVLKYTHVDLFTGHRNSLGSSLCSCKTVIVSLQVPTPITTMKISSKRVSRLALS